MKSAFAIALCLVAAVVAKGQDEVSFDPTRDEDVPYGVASSWLVGHQLLEAGQVSEALPHLHMAYRADPDAPVVALDFQAALLAEGYLGDAINVVEHLAESYPDSVDYGVLHASLLLKGGDAGAALQILRRIRDDGYTSPSVVMTEASILAADGKVDAAIDVLRDGLQLYPGRSAELYLAMADILQKNRRLDEVPDLVAEAIEEHPDDPTIRLIGMRALAVLDRGEEALAIAREADEHFAELRRHRSDQPPAADPEAAEAPGIDAPESFLVELADQYAQHRQPGKALGVLAPLAEAGELDLLPSLWYGRLLLGTGRHEEGAAFVDGILERWPDAARGWFLKGKAAEAAGDWNGSLPHHARAVEMGPYDPEIRLAYVRAMLVAWEGDLSAKEPTPAQLERREALREHTLVASGIVPENDAEGQLVLGYAFRTIGDDGQASSHFQSAAEDPDLRMGALIQASICFDDLGKTAQARQVLERLRRDYPENAEVANSLGYFLAEKDVDLEVAENLVREALLAEPGNGAYLDSLGWIHYRQGDFEGALDLLIQAVNVLPDDPVILEHLGMVLKASGKGVQALDILRRSLAEGGDPQRLRPIIADLEAGLAEKP